MDRGHAVVHARMHPAPEICDLAKSQMATQCCFQAFCFDTAIQPSLGCSTQTPQGATIAHWAEPMQGAQHLTHGSGVGGGPCQCARERLLAAPHPARLWPAVLHSLAHAPWLTQLRLLRRVYSLYEHTIQISGTGYDCDSNVSALKSCSAKPQVCCTSCKAGDPCLLQNSQSRQSS